MNTEGKIYVSYLLNNKKYRSVWDAEVGKQVIIKLLKGRGAENISVLVK